MEKAHVSTGGDRIPAANDLDTTLDELRAKKTALERRLAELERHLTLTPAEQVERARIKKEKLWIKDRLLALGQPV